MLMQKIEEVLDRSIRPLLKNHGGAVNVIDFRDGVIFISLSGACSGCPLADIGTRQFIEEKLREELPEIDHVELNQPIDQELLDLARELLRGNDAHQT